MKSMIIEGLAWLTSVAVTYTIVVALIDIRWGAGRKIKLEEKVKKN